jgi:KipI family sensor histidine kinase inhibitor
MRLLPCGDHAILVELADRDERRRLDRALRTKPIPLITEHVPADHTVLVRVARPRDLQPVADAIRRIDLAAVVPEAVEARAVTIPVRYDGPDLAAVAEHLGLTVSEVIERHSGQPWRVGFGGFAPGFAYLDAVEQPMPVPRRDSARTRIPAGSVGLAGDYSGVYPTASPGGWQLIGTTDVALWAPDREPPALLTPGTVVHFEALR